MNKTKMASVLAVALALALVTGCASSPKKAQKEAQQRRNEERAKLAEGAAKAKPLSFWTAVPFDSLWYSIQPAENNTAIVYTWGNQATTLKAYNSNMNLIAENRRSRSGVTPDDRNARLEFPVEAGKTYYLYVMPTPEENRQHALPEDPWQRPTSSFRSTSSNEQSTITAELKVPAGTLTDGESMVKNGVTISYSDGLISMTNNSGKAARVIYRHEPIMVPSTLRVVINGETVETKTTMWTTGATTRVNAGDTDEARPSWDNPPKEIIIRAVVLIED